MEIFVIGVLILLNGFFALSEIALVSSRKTRLEGKRKKGAKGAASALKLLERPEQFLSAIQIGITLIGIVSGAYGGVALADDIAPTVQKVSFLQPYAYQVSIIIVVGLITYFSILVGELLPKTIAMTNPEKIAVSVAPVIYTFSRIVFPLVGFLSLSTKLLRKLLFIKNPPGQTVTEEELRAMIRMARVQGILEKKESEYHENLFRFADRRASHIMTHRSKVISIELHSSKEKTERIIRESGFSKYPVYNKNIDNLVGILFARDFFEKYDIPGFKLARLVQAPIYIQESMDALRILELFRKKKKYVGIVVDEYGIFSGIITLHDLLENIVGNLPEADDMEQPQVVKREDGSFLIDGLFKMDELENILPELHENADEAEYTTIAGFILYHLGTIPKAGEYINQNGYHFEVVDMDGQRIDKVLVYKEKF